MDRISFRELLSPVTVEAFLDSQYDREPLYLPGSDRRFDGLFSWDQANKLLDNLNIWSAATLKVVLHGRTLSPEEFCKPVPNRDGITIPEPDRHRVQTLIHEGATIVLNFAEMLTPELATISAALQCWLGGETGCNVYCSFGGHQGFQSHFDPQDVFALQIDGTKTWRIYEGRFDQTVNVEGYRTNSFSDSHHEQARGAVRMEVNMTPGDFLYIPRGQYHDALATSDASLHLTYGVERLSGFHLLNTVTERMSRDPVICGKLPRFDDAEAHRGHLAQLADHIYAHMVHPETGRAIRAQQRARTFNYCYPTYAMPKRIPAMLFRVRSLHVKLLRRGPAWWLERPLGGTDVSADEATLIEWMLNRDYFSVDEVLEGCGGMDTGILTTALERFAAIELIEEI